MYKYFLKICNEMCCNGINTMYSMRAKGLHEDNYVKRRRDNPSENIMIGILVRELLGTILICVYTLIRKR